jgi:hypothetical protein
LQLLNERFNRFKQIQVELQLLNVHNGVLLPIVLRLYQPSTLPIRPLSVFAWCGCRIHASSLTVPFRRCRRC